ncbi:hypothetical protein BBK14_25160 [Parafrankia soli]|uniref:Uncharacterized protein n=1 Tax=Parafrankia soli TaxID=2599596 RepID=A0A1S1PIN5_9ACTN|nr:hypothetical protein BBK14_25160 [Parafrankia soli]
MRLDAPYGWRRPRGVSGRNRTGPNPVGSVLISGPDDARIHSSGAARFSTFRAAPRPEESRGTRRGGSTPMTK